ncbi:hypothetical protein CANINC_003804 [Pichia inconspicua]|uniref:Vacuolar fusion protein MON1 n=1 Tax=Pichia inconspicua TaxID=52247 RepID=A0A4T0WXX3_9ASCO|nr:hypothetical protein CANINC_003804 [[Candida] inconspicua]
MDDGVRPDEIQCGNDYFAPTLLTNDIIGIHEGEESSMASTQRSLRKTPSIVTLSSPDAKNTGIIFNELRTVPTSGMSFKNAIAEPKTHMECVAHGPMQQDDTISSLMSTSSDNINITIDSEYDNTYTFAENTQKTGFPYEFSLPMELSDDDPDTTSFYQKQRHFFIVSSAGKPIYSMHGSYDLLVVYAGIIQTIISFFEISSQPQNIKIVESYDKVTGVPIKLVFLNRNPIILMSVVKNDYSTPFELEQKLDFIYSFLISALSKPYIDKVFNKYANFDLLNLLGNTDIATINSICEDLSNDLNVSQVLGGLTCLRMHDSARSRLENKMINMRTPELLYGLIIGPRENLISIIRPKRHTLHTSDLMILFEMIYNTNNFKTKSDESDSMKFVTSETFWVPICLPKFNSTGHLYTLLQFYQLNDDRLLQLHNIAKPEKTLPEDSTKVGIVLMSPYKDAFGAMKKVSNEIAKQILFDKKIYKDIWNGLVGNGRVVVNKILPSSAPDNISVISGATMNTKKKSTFSSMMNTFLPFVNSTQDSPYVFDSDIVHFAVKNKRLVCEEETTIY